MNFEGYAVRTRGFVSLLSLIFLFVLTGCGENVNATDESTTNEVVVSSSTSPSKREFESIEGEISTSSAVTTSEVAAPENFADPLPEITPVDCQVGLGPIITTWSDGTVGGWSQHCQDVHDEVLAGEVAANTPVCDGVVCTYPSGATMPDPNAPQIPSDTSGAVCDENQCVYPNGYIARIGDPNVPNYLKPGNSPWVQGQIDFQNCLDSGKTIEQCREELN